jgi:hypothetical protein
VVPETQGTRRWSVRLLLVLGGVLAASGLIAGHLNRNLLDGPTFAANVDEVRRTDAVATQVGEALAEQIVLANPDLVALLPLVESVSVRIAGGDLLSGPVQSASLAAHTALTEDNADSVVLRISDAAALVTAVIGAVAPDRAPAATEVSVTLASIGDQAFASATIAVAHRLGVMAWLLPLLALVCLVGAVLLSADRWRGALRVGMTLLWAAGGVGLLLAAGGLLVRRADADTMGGAFAQAAWTVFVRPMWWSVVVLAAVGLTITLVVGSTAPSLLDDLARRFRARIVHASPTPARSAIRAGAALVVGFAAIVDPAAMIEVVVLLTGIGLVLFALTQVAELAAPSRSRRHAIVGEVVDGDGDADGDGDGDGRESIRSGVSIAVVAVAALVLAAGVVWMARPGDDVAAVAPGGAGEVCNGHAALCDRPFDQVAYPTSHNAMSVAREPGWFLAEQIDPIRIQFDQGVRALQIDVWSGRSAGSVVRTAAGSYDEALAVAEAELGPEVVDAALRIADSLAGVAEGPEARYLCHGLCEAGSTPLLDVLQDVRVWLTTNPDEVLTLFIEDHVDAALIAADVEAAGLLPFVHSPVVGEPWPTLGDMIRSGQRLVVMLEAGAGDDAAPWLVNGFEHTQETPFTFPTVEDFSCAPNRGPDDGPLFQLNHWLFGFNSQITDAQLVNTREVLLARAEQCREERGQIPNFVAVNFVTIGDLFEVVDALNGVGG